MVVLYQLLFLCFSLSHCFQGCFAGKVKRPGNGTVFVQNLETIETIETELVFKLWARFPYMH